MLRWRADTLTLLVRVERLGWEARVPDLSKRTIPASTAKSRGSRSLRRLRRLRAPLRSSRPMYRRRLVSLRVNILRNWSIALVGGSSRSLAVLQKLQTSLDMDV
jgi:hypothetical protein